MKATAFALLCLVLAACGGGGDAGTCSAPTIQLFGDSTQALAVPDWQARYGPRIIDSARYSSGTRNLLEGTNGIGAGVVRPALPPWPQPVLAGTDFVVVNLGLVDGYTLAPATFVPVSQYKTNLRAIVAASPVPVILETPNQSTLPGRDMTLYAQAMRDVAAETGLRVIDTFACFQTMPNWQAHLDGFGAGGGAHPDAAGLQFIVDTCVAPVIDQLPCSR
jgi:hypothetical protein